MAAAFMPEDPAAANRPRVTLVNAFAQPLNNAMATARTCYMPRLVTADEVGATEAARAQRDAIAASTYAAGHHTTLQHAHFQFTLDNVSRQLIWSFLHAHPFYNSEQVSQRYVAVRPERAYVPPLTGAARTLYLDTLALQMQAYSRLTQLLTAAVAEAYFKVFPARRKHAERYRRDIKKKAQEVARSALPVATFAHLYHTISGLTLHRYHRLCRMLDVPQETQALVSAMVQEVEAVDPLFLKAREDALPLEATPEYTALERLGKLSVGSGAADFVRAFDAELKGAPARLVAATPDAEALLARSVRCVLGVGPQALSDAAAIAQVLAPNVNTSLGGALNLTSLSKLGRTLVHVHYTFQKKLSHAADSQEQRHRMVPGARPVLHTHYSGGTPDVVVPPLLGQVPAALECFMQAMAQTTQAIDQLLDSGVSAEHALYLLPNAFPIRFYESGDLAGLHHKWTTRLCYNAQDEIWRASVAEVAAVRRVHPLLGVYMNPPCGLRQMSGQRPLCPEGPRYCGVPVWKLSLEQYVRTL